MKNKNNTTAIDSSSPTIRRTGAAAFGLLLGSLLILAASIIFPENSSR